MYVCVCVKWLSEQMELLMKKQYTRVHFLTESLLSLNEIEIVAKFHMSVVISVFHSFQVVGISQQKRQAVGHGTNKVQIWVII